VKSYIKSSIRQRIKNLAQPVLASVGLTVCFPVAAYAIPSPELVIGSVSSLGQVFAVGFAMVSGLGAIVASKLGFSAKKNSTTKYPVRLIGVLAAITLALLTLNYWQYITQKSTDLARLQATLVRPAQFSGTEINDISLKETSFSRQLDHPQGISTKQAATLLAQGTTAFYDIRETGENAMGTLPGATHIRFPDFLQSRPVTGDQPVVLFCHNGNRSSETCEKLAALGIDCRFISGGI
jgi:rifampicin phosphotransferase